MSTIGEGGHRDVDPHGGVRLSPAPGSRVAAALQAAQSLPRRPLTSVVLALVLLAMPLTVGSSRGIGSLSILEVEILVLLGLVGGWAMLDRLRAMRASVGWSVMAGVGAAVVLWLAWTAISWPGPLLRTPQTLVAASLVAGGLVRGRGDARTLASLVVIAALASWLTWDAWRLLYRPLRDLHLYLDAGATALAGQSPYLAAPMTSSSADLFPFVYPPFTIPLFELLARLPLWLAEGLWAAASIAAVVAGLWLIGVRGRWLLVFLAWPVLAQGVAAGNVASYTFFLFAAGYRAGAAIVLSGAFKVQSMIPTLWLVGERRWRQLGLGVLSLALLAAVSLPIVGLDTWLAWPEGLRNFQASLAHFPSVAAKSLWRVQPALAAVATIVAVALALVARERNALARFGVASVVASPTLYLHGLSPLLAGMLVLGPELLWFTSCLGLWPLTPEIDAAWFAMAAVGLALLLVPDGGLRIPDDLSAARADLHPAGTVGQIWPGSTG